jgi:hypothetical protein
LASNDIFIGLALDRSGSMASIWEPSLQAINEFKNGQREVPGNAWMTVVTFDNEISTPYYAWNVVDLPDLSNEIAYPRGSTSLLDAIGELIHSQEKWLSENIWFTGKVLTVVQTDGMENSSSKFNNAQIAELIRQKESAGWVFVYLGANQDAWSVASSMGSRFIGTTRTYEASAKGVNDSYTVLSAATTAYRGADKVGSANFADMNKDNKTDTSSS